MQIIENSIVGTRSAVLRLTRRGGGPVIFIFPMLHVAEPQFYREVERRLRACDLVVAEGILGKSQVGEIIMLTYRVKPANEESGLVVDDIPYRALGVPLITPDMTGEEFEQSWRELRRSFRWTVMAVAPIVAIGEYFNGRRSLLSPDIEVNDLPDADDELLDDDDFEKFDEILLTRRDNRVLAALAEVVRDRTDGDVAVTYGAHHVPGILRGLYPLGYRVVSAEWLMVVSPTDPT